MNAKDPVPPVLNARCCCKSVSEKTNTQGGVRSGKIEGFGFLLVTNSRWAAREPAERGSGSLSLRIAIVIVWEAENA